ncbi:hypothetical protein [Flavilitoribacter nigricans]|uniref:Uncharacterized protein n=1 Tax=Flavilitoribacter nigricans (strain ATCC 23147 / DSM 23189 / NBRC 102662 / NCIMB 1420 / SS-2) TaxID=1122177 RepID=A0A2D0MXL7_FLAN2|nr:hypothetical protein [Flavilitoribacter nigricans]PHN01022.1 hypothetical protein CRP01_39135 [Flavilitoribacter nigricans DSM 23189 = NBRC 102662]
MKRDLNKRMTGKTGILLAILGLLTALHCAAPTQSQVSDWPGYLEEDPAVEVRTFSLHNRNQLPIPDGKSSYHQQGMQRLADGGWAVSGSDEEYGYLYFTDAEGTIHTKFTVPTDLNLSGSAADLKYNHPGGFQIIGNVLAVGIENTDLRKESYARVVLLDISDPRAPQHLPHLDIVREAEAGKIMSAGAVGITELEDAYLITVGNWDSRRFDFYRTSSKDLQDPATRVSACLGSWIPGEDGNSYQNFNLYVNSAEALYGVGLYSVDRTRHWADFFRLDISDWENIRHQGKRAVEYRGGEEEARFVHAAGSRLDPATSRLEVFSTEAHAHDGVVRCNVWSDKQ